MALIKKVDVPKYFAARRAMRLGTATKLGVLRPGSRPEAKGDPEAKATEPTPAKD